MLQKVYNGQTVHIIILKKKSINHTAKYTSTIQQRNHQTDSHSCLIDEVNVKVPVSIPNIRVCVGEQTVFGPSLPFRIRILVFELTLLLLARVCRANFAASLYLSVHSIFTVALCQLVQFLQ